MRFLRAAALAAVLCAVLPAAVAPAWAADNFTFRDAGGVTRTSRSKEVSSVQIPVNILATSGGALIDPATSTKQPALGVAGTASADVITVQGVTGMVAIKVDGSAVTQPVSVASLPLPTGAASAANQATVIGHVDGVEGLLSTLDGRVDGLEALITTLNGYVDAVEAKLDTAIASLAVIETAAESTDPATVEGTVAIDQTTPGTTNGVRIDNSGATGAAVPARAGYAGAVSSGNLVGLIQADASVPISISTATTTQLVALTSGQKIYVTSWDVIAAGTGNFKLVYGTGTACGTGTADLTGNYNLTAQTGEAKGTGLGPVLVVPAGNALCATTSAAVGMAGSVAYTKF